MKHVLASLAISALLLLPSTASVFATGQPGSSAGVACGGAGPGPSSGLMTPGSAAASPGSVFNEPFPVGTSPTGGKAGQVYAGNPGTPSLANGSPNAVSQYDVACLQVTTATTHQPP
jgi:hypothetical protein